MKTRAEIMKAAGWHESIDGSKDLDVHGVTETLIVARLEELIELLETPSLRTLAFSAYPQEILNESYGKRPIGTHVTEASLQARADYNRDNAAMLYSDKLSYLPSLNRWVEDATGNLVVFTPYGWRSEE